MKGKIPSVGRYNHTSVIYHSNIIIFGGQIQYNKPLNQRNCIAEPYAYDILTNIWKVIDYTGERITPRRNHAVCLVGKKMILLGGIDNRENFLSDIYEWDLETQILTPLKIAFDTPLFPIAYHSLCFVNKFEEYRMNSLYMSYEIRKSQEPRQISHEGIYLFGGKKTENEINSELWILKLGVFPLVWYKPELKGKGPSPRWQCTCEVELKNSYLIVYGGRNDQVKNGIFNDIFVLDLEFMEWKSIEISGINMQPLCAQASTLLDNKLVIFGGYNFKNHYNSQLYVCYLESKLTKPEKKQLLFKIDEKFFINQATRAKKNRVTTFLPLPNKNQLNSKKEISKYINIINDQESLHKPFIPSLFKSAQA